MPISREEDKEMLADLVKWYLTLHKEVDLRVFLEGKIDFSDLNTGLIREIANILRKSGEYEITESGLGDTLSFFIKPIKQKTWSERNPVLDKVRTGFITFLFSLTTGIILYIVAAPKTAPNNTLQNKRLDSLIEAIKNPPKQQPDSSSR